MSFDREALAKMTQDAKDGLLTRDRQLDYYKRKSEDDGEDEVDSKKQIVQTSAGQSSNASTARCAVHSILERQ